MLPLVYSQNTPKSDFDLNGEGYLHGLTECYVTERLDGFYELEAKGYKDPQREIVPHVFLKVPPNAEDEPQIFEVYSTPGNDKSYTIKAQHNRYIVFNNIISERITDTTARTPAGWWSYISEFFACASVWSFTSDITSSGVITAAGKRPIRLGDFLRGTKGSMLDVFGGDFKYINFGIQLLSRRGTDTEIAVRFGSNVSSYSQSCDGSAVYTHFLPFAYVRAETEGGESSGEMAVYHNVIDLNCSRLTYERALSYDFSDDFRDDVLILPQGGGAPTNYAAMVSKLDLLASEYVARNGDRLRAPSVNITIDKGDVLRTLQKVKLGDTVLVELGALTEPVRVRVIGVKYDVLNERIAEVELGTIKKRLADLFNIKNPGGV